MLQSTCGWTGYHKNVPGVACSVDGVFLSGDKAVVIHLSRWFFMINKTNEGKLKAYEVRTLKTLRLQDFPLQSSF